jgi:hypothetical protein
MTKACGFPGDEDENAMYDANAVVSVGEMEQAQFGVHFSRRRRLFVIFFVVVLVVAVVLQRAREV